MIIMNISLIIQENPFLFQFTDGENRWVLLEYLTNHRFLLQKSTNKCSMDTGDLDVINEKDN